MRISYSWAPLLVFLTATVVYARDYRFDGKISPEVLKNYLSRSITFQDLLTEKGNLNDNIRMLTGSGAKFILLYKDRLLLDFHSFPLRIAEVPDRPQEGVLRVGFVDSIYGRSRGGLTPSGWRCEHLPYLVELDNWGVSHRPGQAGAGGCWVWGYDEICWFAHQSTAYRNQWLRYAWNWLREHDAAGFLEMPGSRCLDSAVAGKRWYFANTPSAASPDGFGQEETIRQIWASP